jgi:xylulokinase
LLGVDLGTSSVKVGVFQPDGDLLSFARAVYEAPAGATEADPESWWAATAAAIRQATSDLDANEISAVCVGGQGPTLVLVDEVGRPVRAALTWMDTRSAPQAARLAKTVGSDRVTWSLVPRLAWVAQHEPHTLARARWALQAWDFLACRLAGGQVGVASTFAGDVVWRDDWLAAAGLERSLVPRSVDAGVAYAYTDGAWAAQAGLPSGIPVVGGINDGIGSIVGAAGSVVGRATDPGGAAGGLALAWDAPVSVPGVSAWSGIAPATHIIGGAFVAGGRVLDWWAAACDRDTSDVLALAAEAPPGAAGLVCLPFLAGERSPIWDPSARGAFIGLTFEHGPSHLARAVLESTAFELRMLTDAVLGAGTRIEELRVCGGQARSRLWNQVKADVTGLPAHVPRLPEVALMGDAICAAVGVGLYPDLLAAGEAMVHIAEVVEPNASLRGVYDTLFGVYRAAYGALKPFFEPLARAAQATAISPTHLTH